MTTSTVQAAGAPPATLPSAVRLGLVRAGVELRAFWRERDAVVFVFAYPIILLAIFSAVFGAEQQGDTSAAAGAEVDFARYFLPGMIATGVMLTSFQALAIAIAVERDDGTLKRLRATPLPPASFFVGKVLLTLATSLAQTTLLIALAALVFDVPLPTDPARWATFAWVFVLGTATGTVCGVAFSSVPRSGRSATAVVTPVVLVLQFISGVFFAFYALPGWMQTVASVFPLKWMAQGMRSVFLPPDMVVLEPGGTWQHGMTAAVLVAWLVAGLFVGVRTFRWRRRDDG